MRPTKAVVVKALTDILRPVLPGLKLLELFAGTGRVSEKLLAGGAEVAYAVDHNPPDDACKEGMTWFQRDVFEFLQKQGPPEKVDLVFMDPPYGSENTGQVLRQLLSSQWLSKQAIVAVESSVSHPGFPKNITGDSGRLLVMMREREYGGTRLTLFQLDRQGPGV